MAALSLEEKKKVYLRVAWYLAALTVIELAFVYAPFPEVIKTILICIASLLKAVCVGWWYMHLNHETSATKFLAIIPFVIAFFYATYLVVDARLTNTRQVPEYYNAPARVFKGDKEAAPAVETKEKEEEAPASGEDDWS